jgi:hypothetical protein
MSETNEVFTAEEVAELAVVQRIRGNLLKQLTVDGTVVPPNTADKVLLATLLDGSDRQILTRVKMRHDKKANEGNAAATAMVAQLLRSLNSRTYEPASPEDRVVPESLQERTFVPGELDPISVETPTFAIAQQIPKS